MSKNKSVQYTINILVFVCCGIFAFIGNSTLQALKTSRTNLPKNIESEWRQQAKYTLADTTERFNKDVSCNKVDSTSNESLQRWAKKNISGLLNGGPTGDALMVRVYYENGKLVGKFIWDGSPDCARPSFITNGRYLSDEPAIHRDPKQAEYIVSQILLAQSTLTSNKDYWWNFDGSPEYLEWDVIPSGVLGFNEEPVTLFGDKNEKFNKIVILLGTQEDEVQSTFANDFASLDNAIYYTSIMVYISTIASILNISMYIYLNKKMRKIA